MEMPNLPMYSVLRLVSRPNSVGIVLLRELSQIASWVRLVSLPISDGILPDRWLIPFACKILQKFLAENVLMWNFDKCNSGRTGI